MMTDTKRKSSPLVYPELAETVQTSVTIPLLPREIRAQYARPDTLRMYVAPDDQADSDEEYKRESQRKKLNDRYKNKSIRKVVDKVRSDTGQVTYKVIWETGRMGEVELVPSKGLQDHPDWGLVEAFEYTKSKHQGIDY